MDNQIFRNHLAELENKLGEIHKLCNTEEEKKYAEVSLNILKLDWIDEYINNNCKDVEVLEVFKLYSSIAVRSIKAIMN